MPEQLINSLCQHSQSSMSSSVGESSDNELDCSTDLLEAMLVGFRRRSRSGISAASFHSYLNGVKTQRASSNVAYRKMPQATTGDRVV
jgi:hypothetical protein